MADICAQLQDMPPRQVKWGVGKIPAGNVVVGVTAEGELCRVTYLRGREPGEVAERWQREWPHTHFKVAKVPKDFLKLPLLMVGNEFQKEAWLEIMRIPYGQVMSYGMVAERIDMPGRARAVGRACNMCCLDYVVPCHRVVAANGIGGYGIDGIGFKEELLKAEGVALRAGRRRYYG